MLYREWVNIVLHHAWLVCWPLVSWSHLVWCVTGHCIPSLMVGLLTSGQLESFYMVSNWTLYSFTHDWSIDLWSAGAILYGEWSNVELLQPRLVFWPIVSWSHLIWWVIECWAPLTKIGVLANCQLEPSYMVSNWTLYSFIHDWSVDQWAVGAISHVEWMNVLLLHPWLVCWSVVRWRHLISWVTERCVTSPWFIVNLWSVGAILYGE